MSSTKKPSLIKRAVFSYFSPLRWLLLLLIIPFDYLMKKHIEKRFKTVVIPNLPKAYKTPADLIDYLSNRIIDVLNAASENDLNAKISIFKVKDLQQVPGFYQNDAMLIQLLGTFIENDVYNTMLNVNIPKVSYSATLGLDYINQLLCNELIDTVRQSIIDRVGEDEKYDPYETVMFVSMAKLKSLMDNVLMAKH